ncbi:MAG: hypothetical protein C4518_15560 [Desulfobacteraceae bacterium]|nr:MAG: hypothetical protein C4518_15560 [Desulfobacteraceae bacterium]
MTVYDDICRLKKDVYFQKGYQMEEHLTVAKLCQKSKYARLSVYGIDHKGRRQIAPLQIRRSVASIQIESKDQNL